MRPPRTGTAVPEHCYLCEDVAGQFMNVPFNEGLIQVCEVCVLGAIYNHPMLSQNHEYLPAKRRCVCGHTRRWPGHLQRKAA